MQKRFFFYLFIGVNLLFTRVYAMPAVSPEVGDTLHRKEVTVLSDRPVVSIKATADEICEGEKVTLSVQKDVVVGDILCTDGTVIKPEQYSKSEKTAKGIVFWIDDSGQHGWVIHLQEKQDIVWSLECVDIPGLRNYGYEDMYTDTAGYRNTKIIREFGAPALYPAAYAVDYEHGWCLPAAGQLVFLQSVYHEINPSLAVVGGTLILPKPNVTWGYWSSTESSDKLAIRGSDLRCRPWWKLIVDRVRAVCSF